MIPFTQYVMPDGRRRDIEIDRPPEIEARALALFERGLRFEAEVLTTGEVSLTVADPEEERDIAIEIVPNGPGVPEAVDRLIADAEKHLGIAGETEKGKETK